MLEFVDSHCHIHTSKYFDQPMAVIQRAKRVGVKRFICVGTDDDDSQAAIKLANQSKNVWASIGIHPHAAGINIKNLEKMVTSPKVVAIGECGLDYHYGTGNKKEQLKTLSLQLDLAQAYHLPVILHVRDAFNDFWPIFDKYPNSRGVFHSFSAGLDELNEIMHRNLYIGLNGITTFSRDLTQLQAFAQIPLSRLLLETDAPYLTPIPFRGKVNEPRHIVTIATFLSGLRQEKLETIAQSTTQNTCDLFGLSN